MSFPTPTEFRNWIECRGEHDCFKPRGAWTTGCPLALYLRQNGHPAAIVGYSAWYPNGDLDRVPLPDWADLFTRLFDVRRLYDKQSVLEMLDEVAGGQAQAA